MAPTPRPRRRPAPRQRPRAGPRWNQPTLLVPLTPHAAVRRAVGFIPRTEVDRWRQIAQEPPQTAGRRVPGLGWALWWVIAIPTAFLALILGFGLAFLREGKW